MNVAVGSVRRLDWAMVAPVACLVALGVVMVYSASAFLGASRYDSATYFLQRHAIRVLLGVGLLAFLMRVDYHRLQRLAPWALGGSVLLLGVLLAFGGEGVRGANRWLSVATFTIQPTEVARVACVVYLAHLLDKKGDRIAAFRDGLLPACLVLGVLAFLILKQPNLGSTIALLSTGFALLYLAGAKRRHLALLVLAGAIVASLTVLRNPYMMDRVVAWQAQWGAGQADALGKNWQVSQSILALGSGGVFGMGAGHGLQKVFFLPDPHTDFIYAVVGEEFGLLGTVGVLVAYVALFLRGLKVAANAPDRFGRYLAAGLTINLSVYVAMNVAVVTGVIPTTGLPLPFLSYGGSALVVNLALVGVLLNIASQADGGARPAPIVRSGGVRAARG